MAGDEQIRCRCQLAHRARRQTTARDDSQPGKSENCGKGVPISQLRTSARMPQIRQAHPADRHGASRPSTIRFHADRTNIDNNRVTRSSRTPR